MSARLSALLRGPLAHFIVLGAALFAVYGALDRGRADAPGPIVVSRGQIDHLTIGFTRTWQRPPSAEELRILRQEIDPTGFYI